MALTSEQPRGLDGRIETAPRLLILLVFIPCMADLPRPRTAWAEHKSDERGIKDSEGMGGGVAQLCLGSQGQPPGRGNSQNKSSEAGAAGNQRGGPHPAAGDQ